MSGLLAIDPGLALEGGTGWAWFLEGRLTLAGLALGGDGPLIDRISNIYRHLAYANYDEVVIEKMKVYEFAKQKGSQGDLVDLAILSGRLMALGAASLVEPAGWKGQVPKDVVKGLVEARLDAAELAALEQCFASGRIGQMQCAARPIAPGKRHNVYDAVGIGLWKLRRWPK